jgi:hypothetical protein
MKKILILSFIFAACGQQATPRREASPLEGVADLKGNNMAAAAVAAQTETENGKVSSDCLNLLLADGKDVFVNEVDDQSYNRGRDVFCSMEESVQVRLLQESIQTKYSASKSFSNAVDAVIKQIPFKSETDYHSNDASTYDSTKASFDAKVLRNHLCKDQSKDEYRGLVLRQIQTTMSPLTLDKYNACVSAKSYGLKCSVERHGDDIKATIRWEPTEIVRGYLPVVASIDVFIDVGRALGR